MGKKAKAEKTMWAKFWNTNAALKKQVQRWKNKRSAEKTYAARQTSAKNPNPSAIKMRPPPETHERAIAENTYAGKCCINMCGQTPKIHTGAEAENTQAGERWKNIHGQSPKIHWHASAEKTCVGRCWKHILGQKPKIHTQASAEKTYKGKRWSYFMIYVFWLLKILYL